MNIYWEAYVYGWSSNGDTDLEYSSKVEGSSSSLMYAITEAWKTPHVKRVTIEVLNKDSMCEQSEQQWEKVKKKTMKRVGK